MKISLNWLKDYIDLPEEITPEKILYDLTMTTVEVEGYESLKESLTGILVGKVTELLPHPKADRLQIAMTDIGGGEVKQIVCGGSNLSVGMYVAVGAPGAMVRWHGEGELVELKETKIRGESSYGMICAANEIGLAELFPTDDEKEIVDLSYAEHNAGTTLADALGLDDVIFEIDNKSLTNRPDLWGHYGIARELAAIYSLSLKPLPNFTFPKKTGGLAIEIEDSSLCPRFIGVLAEGVSYATSPMWMRTRLASVGQRPIDLLVDLTNYVMFAIGRPTHAFDAEQVPDTTLHVRGAKEGENLTLLDGTELTLSKDSLIVADKEKPLTLAGIVGGKSSGISQKTKTLLFEAATWEPKIIRKRATEYGVRTESSIRFEKGLDPYMPKAAAELFFSLLTEIQPDVTVTGFLDQFPEEPKELFIEVTQAFIDKRIGRSLDIPEHLIRLGFTVKEKDGKYVVGVPPWRATGDVSIPVDIVEEVARLYGYDNIDFVPPKILLTEAVHQPEYQLERNIREYLSDSGGMFEVFSYPWADESFVRACKIGTDSGYRLTDPPAPEHAELVTDLIPNLLILAKRNSHETKHFRIYEVGTIYHPGEFETPNDLSESLPKQSKQIAGLVCGEDTKEVFLTLKGVLEGLFHSLGYASLTFKPDSTLPGYLSRDAALTISIGDTRVGSLGIVSPSVLQKTSINHVRLAVFTLDFDSIPVLAVKETPFAELPKYPQVVYDLAPLFNVDVPWQEIESVISPLDPLIQRVSFVNEYTGEQIPEGKKSIAFSMTLGSSEKTLESDEIDTVAAKVLEKIDKKFGATLRG